MFHPCSAGPRRIVAAGVLALLLLPSSLRGAGIPLLDGGGGAHGTAKVVLAKGVVVLKIASLPPLPATVTGATTFTAYEYKAYLNSSADPAVEIFLADIYPNALQKAVRKVLLGGDLTNMGFDRVTVMAFSKDGQDAADVATATLVPPTTTTTSTTTSSTTTLP